MLGDTQARARTLCGMPKHKQPKKHTQRCVNTDIYTHTDAQRTNAQWTANTRTCTHTHTQRARKLLRQTFCNTYTTSEHSEKHTQTQTVHTVQAHRVTLLMPPSLTQSTQIHRNRYPVPRGCPRPRPSVTGANTQWVIFTWRQPPPPPSHTHTHTLTHTHKIPTKGPLRSLDLPKLIKHADVCKYMHL